MLRGKKDEINEIKTYYEKVPCGFAHIYLRLLNPLLVGAPSYKSGAQTVNSRGACWAESREQRAVNYNTC